MACNPILEEIYAAREKLLADYKGNLHACVHDARQRAMASGRPITAPKQRSKPRFEAPYPNVTEADKLIPDGSSLSDG